MCTCLCMNMYVCVCTNRKDSRGSGSSGGSGSGSGEQRWTMNYTFATIQYNLWRVSFGNAWKGTAPNIHKICILKKLSIKDFKKHMNWTKNRFEVLKLAQAINLHKHQENKKKNTVQLWAIFDMGIIYSPANSDSKSTMTQKPPFSMDKLKASIQTI